jgi:hypothetical protein
VTWASTEIPAWKKLASPRIKEISTTIGYEGKTSEEKLVRY